MPVGKDKIAAARCLRFLSFMHNNKNKKNLVSWGILLYNRWEKTVDNQYIYLQPNFIRMGEL